MSYADLSAAVSVGTELKEIYLPSESIFLQMDLYSSLFIFGNFCREHFQLGYVVGQHRILSLKDHTLYRS